MRLILSRKGFDSSSGGCPSPIFPDGSLISMPIPDKTSPVRYRDLNWRGRNLGEIVATLTKGKQRSDYRAHLDPDLRADSVSRETAWKPLLGQHGSAQGHLRNQGVADGDIFIFWGLFRPVDADIRWTGPAQHYIWGWLQIGTAVSVDQDVRRGGKEWRWTKKHPHLSFPVDPSNTLYVAADRLKIPGLTRSDIAGAGVFDQIAGDRCLTCPDAEKASRWSLPKWFLPKGRPPLSYHQKEGRWSVNGDGVTLQVVDRGQEFVLDVDHYPEAAKWVSELLGNAAP